MKSRKRYWGSRVSPNSQHHRPAPQMPTTDLLPLPPPTRPPETKLCPIILLCNGFTSLRSSFQWGGCFVALGYNFHPWLHFECIHPVQSTYRLDISVQSTYTSHPFFFFSTYPSWLSHHPISNHRSALPTLVIRPTLATPLSWDRCKWMNTELLLLCELWKCFKTNMWLPILHIKSRLAGSGLVVKRANENEKNKISAVLWHIVIGNCEFSILAEAR